jgi:methylated-DNA-[protein]-cysteine S-methyltransferase
MGERASTTAEFRRIRDTPEGPAVPPHDHPTRASCAGRTLSPREKRVYEKDERMTPTGFRIHPTPLGDTLVLTSDTGLIGFEFLTAPLGSALAAWTQRLGREPAPIDDDADTLLAQVDEYFEGTRTSFDAELDLSLVSGFAREALEAISRIPYGETASYGEIAIEAGSPRAHRAVGSACAHTPISLVVPAHRVIRSDGSIGEYGGRPEHKRYLLDLEAAHRPAGV